MNEITKDELEELIHCVYAYRDLCDEDIEDSLYDKLKSMIDNYCEHESNNQGFIKINGKKLTFCSKCGEFFNDDQ